MAISYNSGVLKSSDITATTSDASVGQRPDRRRIFNFGDRVAELAPEESPFFVYLNQVAKAAAVVGAENALRNTLFR